MGVQKITIRLWFWFLVLTLVTVCHVASGANEKDKEECAEQLAGLATCLPYVGGNAKSPTPDCCSGLKQVLNTNKKCLCVVVKDRNDPDLGLTINVTLALGLPSVCHTPANVTKCPELLHLAPNSTDAQVFYQYGHSSSVGAPASSPMASANASSRGGVGTIGKRPSGSTGSTGTTWLKREVMLIGVVSCILTFTFVV